MIGRMERTANLVNNFVERASAEDSFVDSLSTLFRRSRSNSQNKATKQGRGRPTAVALIKLTCLATPLTTSVNRLDVGRLKRLGLGAPDKEITPSRRVQSRLPLSWTSEEFRGHIIGTFPPLRAVDFELLCADRSVLQLLPEGINTPAKIKDFMSKVQKTPSIYIRPCVDITSKCIENQAMEEKRSLIETQDVEFRNCLLQDKEKDRRKEELKEEENRLRELRVSRKRDLPEEPVDGMKMKFRTTEGKTTLRKFSKDSTLNSDSTESQQTQATEQVPTRASANFDNPRTTGSTTATVTSGAKGTSDAPCASFTSGVPCAPDILGASGAPDTKDALDSSSSPGRRCALGTPSVLTRRPRRQAADVARFQLMEWTRGRSPSPSLTPEPSSPAHLNSLSSSPSSPPSFDFLPDIEPSVTPASIEPPHDANSLQNSVSLEESLHSILMKLAECTKGERSNIVNVSRDNVLPGALRAFKRKTFDPEKILSVKFAGEFAMDEGGPTREFLRLLMTEISHMPIFTGTDVSKMLNLNYSALQDGTYEAVGKMIAYSIVHGGPAPSFLSPLLYEVVVNGIDSVTPSVDQILDRDYKEQIQKLSRAEDLTGYKAAEDLIQLAGCSSLAHNLSRKEDLCRSLTHFVVLGRVSQCIQLFCRGLETLGVLKSAREHSERMKELFVFEERPLDPSTFEVIFHPQFSPEGSNTYRQERVAHANWRDVLLDIGEGDEGVSLNDLLIFATGADRVPPLGLQPQPTLSFHPCKTHSPEDKGNFPFANTCANQLSLPLVSDYNTFKRNLIAAMQVHIFTTE